MNVTEPHMQPFIKGDFNPTVVIAFVIIVCLIIIAFFVYRKYFKW